MFLTVRCSSQNAGRPGGACYSPPGWDKFWGLVGVSKSRTIASPVLRIITELLSAASAAFQRCMVASCRLMARRIPSTTITTVGHGCPTTLGLRTTRSIPPQRGLLSTRSSTEVSCAVLCFLVSLQCACVKQRTVREATPALAIECTMAATTRRTTTPTYLPMTPCSGSATSPQRAPRIPSLQSSTRPHRMCPTCARHNTAASSMTPRRLACLRGTRHRRWTSTG